MHSIMPFILQVRLGRHFCTYYRGMKHGRPPDWYVISSFNSELRYSESSFYGVDAVSARTVSNRT